MPDPTETARRVLDLDKQATEGPWDSVAGRSRVGAHVVVDEWFVRPVEDETSIAVASDVVDPATGKPSEPNAALIAFYRTAAPDLARALSAEQALSRAVADADAQIVAAFHDGEARGRQHGLLAAAMLVEASHAEATVAYCGETNERGNAYWEGVMDDTDELAQDIASLAQEASDGPT